MQKNGGAGPTHRYSILVCVFFFFFFFLILLFFFFLFLPVIEHRTRKQDIEPGKYRT